MPFRSASQRRKFHAMAARGEISKKTVDKWEAHTPAGKLPEKVASSGPFRKLPKISLKHVRGLLKRAFAETMGPVDPRAFRPDTAFGDTALARALAERKAAKWRARVRGIRASIIRRLRRGGPMSVAMAKSVARPSPASMKALRAGYAAGLLSHLVGNPVPSEVTALLGASAVAAPKVLKDYLKTRRQVRFAKLGGLELGFFDELAKLAQDDELPSGLERIFIQGLQRAGKRADPEVVGKMRQIMHAVPKERAV